MRMDMFSLHGRVALEEFGNGLGVLAVLLHAQRQRFDAGQDQERVERRQRRTKIAQAEHTAGDSEGKITESLLDPDAVIFRPRFAEHWIFIVLRPVEGAGIDDDAADRVAMAGKEFGQRMHDNVRAVINGADQVRGCQRVIDDQGHAGVAGDRRDRLDIGDAAARIGDRLDEDRLGARRDRALEAADIVGIGPCHIPAEALERMAELVDRTAIELARGNELVAWRQQLL